ncbi:MAG: NADH-quinone oxidoreductase subunit C [Candidatus Bathyarchaeia archaeon]|nr:NADH-quinone oxidoreductase subunit C [Candidatus Bathyarchaeota archaeon]
MASPIESEIMNYLKSILGADLIEVYRQRERRIFANVKSEAVRRAIEALKNKYGDMRFMTLSAVDAGLDIEYLYHFHIDGIVLTIRTIRPKENPILESIADLVPAANFIEREISDLFGIRLVNHPEPEPAGLILTKDWPEDKRPLKKPFEGVLPSKARPVAEALMASGCVAPISAFVQKKREEAGLPKSAPFPFTDEKALSEYHGIIKLSGMGERAGFDWEKKKLRYK